MILLGKIALGCASVAVAGIGLLCSEGLVEVNVVERSPERHHVFVVAPALLIPAALHFIPKDQLAHEAHDLRQLREWMPTIRVAMNELRNAADLKLVEVKEENQRVVVKKEGGSIVVDVDEEGETVHVSTPIRAIESSIEELAAAGRAAETQ